MCVHDYENELNATKVPKNLNAEKYRSDVRMTFR